MRISDWSSDVCSSDLIGASIIQGARIAGAREIFAVDIVDSKLEQAKGFGATTTIDSSKTNPVSAIRDQCGGVDYAFDAVGSTDLICNCFYTLGPPGTAVLVGAIPADEKLEDRKSTRMNTRH